MAGGGQCRCIWERTRGQMMEADKKEKRNMVFIHQLLSFHRFFHVYKFDFHFHTEHIIYWNQFHKHMHSFLQQYVQIRFLLLLQWKRTRSCAIPLTWTLWITSMYRGQHECRAARLGISATLSGWQRRKCPLRCVVPLYTYPGCFILSRAWKSLFLEPKFLF